MMTARHTFNLKPRKPQIHHRTRAANRVKAEIIRDVAAIMGDDLNYQQLADELGVPIAMVYHYAKETSR